MATRTWANVGIAICEKFTWRYRAYTSRATVLFLQIVVRFWNTTFLEQRSQAEPLGGSDLINLAFTAECTLLHIHVET